jgi:hypothetical protein
MNKNSTHQNQTDVIDCVLQLLLDHGHDGLAQGYPNAEMSRELVNLGMTRADVAEGHRRVDSFVVTPERG